MKLRNLFLSFSFLFLVLDSSALMLSPTMVELEASGRGRTAKFEVLNRQSEKIAVSLFVTHRKIDEVGKETTPPLEDKKLFNVYPRQVILQPGESKSVRVTWRGPKEVATEQAFRFFAKQLPVENLNKKSKGPVAIQVLVQYISSLYVVPKNPRVKFEVETAETKTVTETYEKRPGEVVTETNNWLLMTVRNTGNMRMYDRFASGKFSYQNTKGETQSLDFDEEQLWAANNENLLPQKKRIVRIPWKLEEMPGKVDVQLSVKE